MTTEDQRKTTRSGSMKEEFSTEISKMRIDLKEGIEELRKEFAQMKNIFQQEVTTLRDEVKELKQDLTAREKRITYLESRVTLLEKDARDKEMKEDMEEAHEKKKDVALFPEGQELPDRLTKETILQLMPEKANIQEEDITEVEDLRRYKGPIVVKFRSIDRKISVIKNQTTKCRIKDSLAKTQRNLLRRARSLKSNQKIAHSWVYRGLVYFQKSEGGPRMRACNTIFRHLEFGEQALSHPLKDLTRNF